MKYLLFSTTIALILSYSPLTNQQLENSSPKAQTMNDEKAMNEEVLRHVVLIKFKESASSEDIAKVEKAFSALPGKISAIKDYEWGTNNSPEGLDKGFTHCFLVTFENEEDRATYLPHPDHKAFVDVLEPHMEDALVVDYWANEN